MDRIIPDKIYEGLPCSMVAVGCAMGLTEKKDIVALKPSGLHPDGYLPLDGLNRLVRSQLRVIRTEYYKRVERPALSDWAHEHIGQRAVICLLGHYIYFNGYDYFSYFENDDDPVVKVWYI